MEQDDNTKRPVQDESAPMEEVVTSKPAETEAREEIIREIFQPARRHYPRMKIAIRGLYETLGADLVDMQKYSRENKGYKHIMTVIDHMSKKAWAFPLKSKTGKELANTLKKIIDEGHPIKNILVDEGTEFFNKNVKSLLEKHGINLYHTYSGIKSAIVERFNRTLRHLMHPELMIRGNNKWVEILPSLIEKYNHSKHRTIGCAPADVNEKNAKEIMKKVYRKVKVVKNKSKFQVGDFVRVSKSKLLFEKGYTPNYSLEIFRVAEVKLSNPRTYLLEDMDGKPIKGRFLEPEMKKTKYPHTYILEKVIRKNKNKDKFYVKYLGFDKPQWINKDDFV